MPDRSARRLAPPCRPPARGAVAAWLALCVASGCAPASDAPELHAVLPGWGWTGESTDITVVGKRLYPDVIVGEPEDDAQFNASFRLFLETTPATELDAVQYVDTSTLSAEVPAGVTPGTYGLRVVTPAGQEAELADAFRVTETRADHLAFVVDRVGYDVTELASVGLQLADPDGGTVAQPMLVELRAESASGAPQLEFDDDALDNQQPLDDGSGVFGNLHADGTASVAFRSALAQDLTLTLRSVEDPAITPASTLLSFSPGMPDHIELTLPDTTITAGDSVDVGIVVRDAAGNAVDATGLRVLVYEECGAVRQSVDLLQSGPYPIQLTTACAGNHLHALGLGVDEAVSAAFDVVPGPIAGYGVRAAPKSVVAGSGVLAVQVDALDAYGNLLPEHDATLRLSDSVGGLTPDRYDCDPFVSGQTICVASPIRAGAAVVVTATDEVGRSGYADPVEIVADVPAQVSVGVEAASVRAGEPFTVSVGVQDAWGNPVDFTPDQVGFVDDTGTLVCTPDAGGTFSCVVTASDAADAIVATVDDLSAPSGNFDVTNAALAQADVAVDATTVVAGASVTVRVQAYDAYGNPYTTPVSGSTVSLADTLGSVSGSSLLLDAGGAGTASVTLTVAGVDILAASLGGVELGAASPVTVTPGSVSALDVAGPAWADVDAGVPLTLTAVDAWGNAVTDYDDVVDVTLDGCDPASVTGFDAGAADVDLACSAPGLQVRAVADDGALAGTSAPIDVLDFACAGGPSAALTLDGGATAVTCLVASSATLAVDTGGTVAGAASLAAWHLDDGAGSSSRSTSAPSSLTYDTAGARRVELVVADADACGSVASAVAYVGNDDGSAVGPITVTPAASSVRSTGSTSVDLAATDCAGDVASGAELYVWADLGGVAGSPTGSGTTVPLDPAGVGSTLWGFSSGHAGTATFSASSADGAGFGSASITVTDDSVRPTVVEVTPAGATSAVVDEVVIRFSEPMLASSLTSASVTLDGPSGAVAATLALAADDQTLTLTPATAIDASAGTYTVGVSAAARDSAGNRISGDWSGAAAAWSSTFGAVTSSLPSTSCAIGASAFRPDGDDGAGAEADAVGVTLSGAPTWWALAVTDADGAYVRRTQVAGSAAALSWDGRGDDGRIVAEGTYTMDIRALDVTDDAELRCSGAVTLSQRGRAP